MHILLLGPPGSGKGTQGALISARYSIPEISMGYELRKVAKGKTKVGRQIKALIEKGNLVPDDITMEILKKRLKKPDCRNGFILDGFPRDVHQAKMLPSITHVDHAIYLDVPEKILVKRLTARRQCKKCGAIYGLEVKPGKKCRKCGGALYQRSDDKIAAIRTRINVFRRSTKPVINFYRKSGKLRRVNGNKAADVIFSQVRKVLR